MTFEADERILETTITTGTTTYDLDGPVDGFQAVSVIGANNYGTFMVTDNSDWEVFVGRYTSGPNRLERTTILRSSNGDVAVDWGAGTKYVHNVHPAWLALPALTSKSVAGNTDVTLTQAEMRRTQLVFTGALTGNISVIVDATPWEWEVYNNTTGNFSLTFKVTGQTGIALTQGKRQSVHCDGTDIRRADFIEFGTTNPIVGGLENNSADGRITLTTAVPVLTSDVTGATTIYYSPYTGNRVDLYDGTSWKKHVFSELSQATTDNTKSPAACANNSNYDLFVWNDAGTMRCTRGPAWTSDTGRGTGAATTELEMVNGRLVNKIAITNGPAAQRGLYVGTVRTNGSAQVDMKFGSIAAGGGDAIIGIWNNYNRVSIAGLIADNNNTWTYNSATYRSVDNSTTNRVSMVRGLQEDDFTATFYQSCVVDGSSNAGFPGLGLDATNANATGTIFVASANVASALKMGVATWAGKPGLGFHYFQALEKCNAVATITFHGDNNAAFIQSGMTYAGRY